MSSSVQALVKSIRQNDYSTREAIHVLSFSILQDIAVILLTVVAYDYGKWHLLLVFFVALSILLGS